MKRYILKRTIFFSIFALVSAVASAQTGTEITKLPCTIETNGDYYLSSSLTLSTTCSEKSAITVNSGVTATLDLKGYTLASSLTTDRVITNNGTLTITDSSEEHTGIIDGKAKTRAFEGSGIINNAGAVLTIKGVKIQKCTTSVKGGAIFNANGATLTIDDADAVITGCSCTGEKAKNGGGGVYNMGKFYFKNGKISSCKSSYQGGGIFSIYDSASSNDSAFEMTGGTIEKCTSTKAGGGIRISNMCSTISGGSVSGCTSSTQGGGVYVDSVDVKSLLTFSDCIISECTSTTDGGGISIDLGASLLMSSGTIEGCKAGYTGGGIFAYRGAKVEVTGGKISGCSSTAADDIQITETTSRESGGGGISISGESTVFKMSQIDSGTPTLVDGCKCINRGGGILFTDGGKGEITGGTISNNTNSNYLGGGIYIGKEAYLSLKDVLITKNIAVQAGGGVFSGNGGVWEMLEGTVISYNKVTKGDSEQGGGGGGVGVGKAISSNEFTMKGGSIINNYSETYGGGIYIRPGGDNDVVINGGTIADNEAKTNGGGICTEGKCTVNGGTISGNKAGKYGGGIYLGGTDEFAMTGGMISGNQATSEGGGVYSKATAQLTGGTIENNTSSTKGGGIYVASGKFSLEGCTMNNNTALKGGAFYVYQGTTTIGKNVVIKANKATQYGGGMFFDGGTIKLTDSSLTISENSSDADGGAIYTDGGTITFTGGLITGNSANYNGAAVYGKSGTLNMNGTVISGNTSGYKGGALYNAGAAINVTSGELSSNKAEYGGGMYTVSGTVKLTGGRIIKNFSNNDGGGIYVNSGKVYLYRGTVDSNTSVGNGGGIYAEGGTIYVEKESGSTEYGYVSNNTALNGGGIFLTSGAIMNFNYGLIMGNSADSKGGTIKTAYQSDPSLAEAAICGVGGGVYVAKGTSSSALTTLSFSSTASSLGLFNNTADNAADDLFADGSYTKLVLPAAKNVALIGIAGKTLGWFGDFVKDDPYYSQSPVYAYGGTAARYREEEPGTCAEYAITASTTLSSKYICLTLAIEPAWLTIEKTGLRTGESAVFILTNSTHVRRIMLTGVDSDGSTVSAKLSNLEVGDWTITEDTKWSWTYTTETPSKTVTIDGTEAKTVSFKNEKSSSKPSNAEAIKNNVLGKTFKINMGGNYLE